MWTIAAENPADFKLIIAVVAMAALALQVALAVIKWRRDATTQPPPDDSVKMVEAAQTAADAAQRTLDAVQDVKAILTREHPQTQQLRVYTPLRLDDRLAEIERRLEELTSTSGVWTDPGTGRKPR